MTTTTTMQRDLFGGAFDAERTAAIERELDERDMRALKRQRRMERRERLGTLR